MKVMLINGSSRPNGCTGTALAEVARTLNAEGIETETIFIGNKPLTDCVACHRCQKLGHCVYDDLATEIGIRAAEFDGFVFGSPVYYGHPSARLMAVMDRAFYATGYNFMFKPAAAVVSARRAGTTSSFDAINKYFGLSSMPVVSSTYWNHVYGHQAEDVQQDPEGLMTMTNIGKNMAWLLKCIELGRKNGLDHPENTKLFTDFVR